MLRLPTFLTTLVVLSCNSDRLVHASDPRCNAPCYTGPAKNAGVGVCVWGKWGCDEDGEVVSCVGFVLPGARSCNGLDNNCDGQPDIFSRPCASACAVGAQTCVDGEHWSDCSATQPKPEVCNGKDDDCNGLVDDNVPVVPCYSLGLDDPHLRHGECRPGITRCDNGVQTCYGEVLPRTELCNGLDDDCDGLVDEDFNTPQDIVFIVDYSGSMSATSPKIATTLKAWSLEYNQSNIQLALVGSPAPIPRYPATVDGQVTLMQNFTSAAAFSSFFPVLGGDGALEASLDAIYDAADYAGNPLLLNWRAGSRRTIIFIGDEYPQTYAPLNASFTPYTVAAFLSSAVPRPQVDFFVAADVSVQYEPMATATAGHLYRVDASSADMHAALDAIIKERMCQP